MPFGAWLGRGVALAIGVVVGIFVQKAAQVMGALLPPPPAAAGRSSPAAT